MNISQVMCILDWDLRAIQNVKSPRINKFYPKEEFVCLISWVKGLTFIVFNKYTSEVIAIEMEKVAYSLNHDHQIDLLKDGIELLSETEILDSLNSMVGKDPDELVEVTIDEDLIKVLDESAARINITRQEYVVKALLAKINEVSE